MVRSIDRYSAIKDSIATFNRLDHGNQFLPIDSVFGVNQNYYLNLDKKEQLSKVLKMIITEDNNHLFVNMDVFFDNISRQFDQFLLIFKGIIEDKAFVNRNKGKINAALLYFRLVDPDNYQKLVELYSNMLKD